VDRVPVFVAAAVAVAALMTMIPGSASAQTAVPAPAQVSQTEKNKAFVLDYLHTVFEALDADAAPRYLSADFVDHNPYIAGHDLAGYQNFLRARRAGPGPLKFPKAFAVVAEGDYVIVVYTRQLPDPQKPGATYEATGFDMYRLANGKITEHWDHVRK
jgi:predicted SnoaL-like aldol condensation-catalyzing enzyme